MIHDIAPAQSLPRATDWATLAQRWRVPLLALGLATLPWIVPSQAWR